MTRYQTSGDGNSRLRVTIFVVALAAVSIAAGAAYSLGIFSQDEAEIQEPLRVTISSDRLDFGDLDLNEISTRQLILRNDGENPMNARILVSDPNIRISPEELILHPGVGSRVVVQLIGDKFGILEDELRVVIDNDDEQPLMVALAGNVWRDASERPTPQAPERRRAVAKRQLAQPSFPSKTEVPLPSYEGGDDPAPGTVSGNRGVVKVASAATPSERENDPSNPTGSTAAVSSTSRRPAASGGSNTPQAGNSNTGNTQSGQRPLVRVTEYNPATSAPIRSLAERPAPIPETISEQEAAKAKKIPSNTPTGEDGEALPERLPDEPSPDDDSRARDADQRQEDDDPFVSPTLTISGRSLVRVLGGTARFSPQAINVAGTDMGGPIGLMGAVDFPVVSLAFGESMLFAQQEAGISGGWDALTGNVQFEVPIQAVDADGDAAPMRLILTTGTAMERNESGKVVAISGAPRNPGTGLLKLVGIAKIPVGYKNGGEEHLAVFEILASLTFGTSISSSDPAPIHRIGG